MVLTLTGPRSTGVEVVEASANPPDAGGAPSSVDATIGAADFCGSAAEPVTGPERRRHHHVYGGIRHDTERYCPADAGKRKQTDTR